MAEFMLLDEITSKCILVRCKRYLQSFMFLSIGFIVILQAHFLKSNLCTYSFLIGLCYWKKSQDFSFWYIPRSWYVAECPNVIIYYQLLVGLLFYCKKLKSFPVLLSDVTQGEGSMVLFFGVYFQGIILFSIIQCIKLAMKREHDSMELCTKK